MRNVKRRCRPTRRGVCLAFLRWGMQMLEGTGFEHIQHSLRDQFRAVNSNLCVVGVKVFGNAGALRVAEKVYYGLPRIIG
jgi:hypothetical protein